MIAAPHHLATREAFGSFIAAAHSAKIRSLRQFVEQEIIIPEGRFEGRRFRVDRQPYTGLWFDAVDAAQHTTHVVTGPTQSGKTLSGFVAPLLWHLFEYGETVVCGVPRMDMAADKWREDIMPVIRRSRFRDLLPRSGAGSRGGKVETLTFRNGATLKFMSAGGDDKTRAGFTTRVLVITETDGMDEAGTTSREADKVTQLIGRTRSYGSLRRIYLECTVSLDTGRTWCEYTAGTASRIMLRCPLCGGWVSPEREHLAGWQDAPDAIEARSRAYFFCPACSQPWSEEDRREAHQDTRLLHRGQAIAAGGQVTGEPPKTDTLGFRWSAVNNFFATAGDVAVDEWKAARALDEDNAEREMRQFIWCLPYELPVFEITPLDPEALKLRGQLDPRSIVPEQTEHLTLGVDIGKRQVHWSLHAWWGVARSHIADYGLIETNAQKVGAERGIMAALETLREMVELGWVCGTDRRIPEQVWIDSAYYKPLIYEFCGVSGTRYRPVIGRGAGQMRMQHYARPKKTTPTVRFIGADYHIVRLKGSGVHLVEVDVDAWKLFVHERLAVPVDGPDAMTFYRAMPGVGEKHPHATLVRHLTAEIKRIEFIPGKGEQVRWERIRRDNHWLDTTTYAAAAAHFCGVRQTATPAAIAPPGPPPPITTPDGRPFLITQRV